MKINDLIELTITDLAEDGKGIGRVEGMAVFVEGAVPGDRVRASVTKAKKHYAFAALKEILEPSPDRVDPPCPYYGRCGGCAMMDLSLPAQHALKQRQVEEKLRRIGGIREPVVREILTADHDEAGEAGSFRYRNKAVFAVLDTKSGPVVGFKMRGSYRVIDIRDCLLQKEPVMAVAGAIRELIRSGKLRVRDERSGKGFLREVTVKLCEGTGEVMVVLTGAARQLPNAEDVVYALDDAIAEASLDAGLITYEEETGDEPVPYYFLQSVVVEYKPGDLKGFAKDYVTAAGTPTVRDRVVFPALSAERDFEISGAAFYQVNTPMMVKLYEQAARYAGLTGEEVLLDLYCGAGTIGLTLTDRANYVIGIEEVPGAVLDANRNAVINGIVRARYYTGRAEEILPQLLTPGTKLYADYLFTEELRDRPVVAVLDPPRAGCEESLLRAVTGLSAAGPEDTEAQEAPTRSWRGADRIVYISCDPGTLARDVKVLEELGYRLCEATPVSQFDHTTHVETVCLLTHS